jgi:hypothetical protein
MLLLLPPPSPHPTNHFPSAPPAASRLARPPPGATMPTNLNPHPAKNCHRPRQRRQIPRPRDRRRPRPLLPKRPSPPAHREPTAPGRPCHRLPRPRRRIYRRLPAPPRFLSRRIRPDQPNLSRVGRNHGLRPLAPASSGHIETTLLANEIETCVEDVENFLSDVDREPDPEDHLTCAFKRLPHGASLHLLNRYEGTINRSYAQAFKQLHLLRSLRIRVQPNEPKKALQVHP